MSADDLGLPVQRGGDGPLVSVVIPTYRDCQYLPDALESVGAQTYGHLEVVLVDSSGVDWVAALAEEREWIRYRREPPRGVSAARNAGIAAAEGDYIALLDADDYWHPAKLERQVAALAGGGRVCYTGHYFVNFWCDDGPVVRVVDLESGEPERAYVDVVRREVGAHTSTLVLHAEVAADHPFLHEVQNFEDVVFAVETFRASPPRHVGEPLSVRRLRPGSLADRTSAADKARDRITGYRYLAEAYPELASQAWRQIGREEYELGIVCLRADDCADARRHFRRSLGHRPSLKAVGLYAASVFARDGRAAYERLHRLGGAVSRPVGDNGQADCSIVDRVESASD